MSEHRIDVVLFRGESARDFAEAHAHAVIALQSWYATQTILFTSDGRSVFTFSTAAYRDDARYVFIITVFDARPRPGYFLKT